MKLQKNSGKNHVAAMLHPPAALHTAPSPRTGLAITTSAFFNFLTSPLPPAKHPSYQPPVVLPVFQNYNCPEARA
jgi:hypothetical protein